MRLSVALAVASVVAYLAIIITLIAIGYGSTGNSADRPVIRRVEPSGYTGTHAQGGYEKALFTEIIKAWTQKSEQWFIKDYIVETEGRWNY